MNFFEAIRRANEDFYTAKPIDAMTDEQLASIAVEVGMTIDELKEHAQNLTLKCLVHCAGVNRPMWSTAKDVGAMPLATNGNYLTGQTSLTNCNPGLEMFYQTSLLKNSWAQ